MAVDHNNSLVKQIAVSRASKSDDEGLSWQKGMGFGIMCSLSFSFFGCPLAYSMNIEYMKCSLFRSLKSTEIIMLCVT